MALNCGTPMYAGVRGTVVASESGGRLGPAYGPWAFRIRTTGQRYDIVIGHVRTVLVRAGDVIEPHQRIALVSDAGAPDGCHLHFEVRPAAASYAEATNPRSLLDLTPSRETTR